MLVKELIAKLASQDPNYEVYFCVDPTNSAGPPLLPINSVEEEAVAESDRGLLVDDLSDSRTLPKAVVIS